MFRLLEPEAFERTFRLFMAAFAKANGVKLTGVVAVDGKALGGAYERGQKATPLHLVNVFAVEARMALVQQKAPGRNETAGALEVLELLSLKGCIVTTDALHCSRAFAGAVLRRGGDYALVVKANRGPLFKAVTQQFARSGKRSSAAQIELSSHGRREARRATVMRNTGLAAYHEFPGVAAVGCVTLAQAPARQAGRYAGCALVSLVQIHLPQAAAARHPQSLDENQLHWVLDVHFTEDGNRARKDNAPENLAVLRRLALNILRTHPDRASIRRKIKRSGWDDGFLLMSYR